MKHDRTHFTNDLRRRIGADNSLTLSALRTGFTIHVPCAPGKHMVDFPCKPGLNPEGISKAMILKGWTVGSRRLCCPDCQPKKLKTVQERKEPVSNAAQTVATTGPQPNPAKPEVSEAAKRAHRMVMMLLEDQYDEANKRYRPGWDDEKVAKETGAAKAHVAATREQYFGPAGEPEQVAQLRADLLAMERQIHSTISALDTGLAAMKKRFNDECRKNGWQAI